MCWGVRGSISSPLGGEARIRSSPFLYAREGDVVLGAVRPADQSFRYQLRWTFPQRVDGLSFAASAPPHHATQLAITRWISGWW